MTFSPLVGDVLVELGILSPGEPASNDDAQVVLRQMNAIINDWNGERPAIFSENFTVYTTTPNLAPHTIGPSGTFVVTSRPVALDAVQRIVVGTPDAEITINIRDADWWDAQIVQGLATGFITDLYYNPKWPNGELNFWPVPNSAQQVQIHTRDLITEGVTLGTTFSMPPGYQHALVYTTAEHLTVSYRVPLEIAGTIAGKAAKARARIFANNAPSARISTIDAGMPRTHGREQANYLLGPFAP